jgi:DNA-binding MarR family transcriptional regulator
MDSHARLWSEFGSLLRELKDLNTHAIEAAGVRCEPAGVHLLGRLSLLGPVRLTELACSLGLDPSSVSRQVSSVERSGLVTREEDPGDRRAVRLVLTDRGVALVAKVQDQRAQALHRLTPGWTDAELDELTDRIARLNHDLAAHRARLDDLLDPELENA